MRVEKEIKKMNTQMVGFVSDREVTNEIISKIKDILSDEENFGKIIGEIDQLNKIGLGNVQLRLLKILGSKTIKVLILIGLGNYNRIRLLMSLKNFEQIFEININEFEILYSPINYFGREFIIYGE